MDRATRQPSYISFAYNPTMSTEAMKKVERRLSRVITQSTDSPNNALSPSNEREYPCTPGMCDEDDEDEIECNSQVGEDDSEIEIRRDLGNVVDGGSEEDDDDDIVDIDDDNDDNKDDDDQEALGLDRHALEHAVPDSTIAGAAL